MTLRTIPLAATPNQTASVVLGERNVDFTLRAFADGLYIDVVCDDVPIVAGQRCTDRTDLTARAVQLGFPDLAMYFADLRGTSDPQWTEFGTRYVLLADTPDAALTPGAPAFTPVDPVGHVGTLVYDGQHRFDGSQVFDGELRPD